MSEPGIAVNPASTISAAEWVKSIQHSEHIPDYLKQGIKAKGNLIVGWAKIVQPANTIPRDWLGDLAAAFASQAWEITTAQETFEVIPDAQGFGVRRRVFPDLQKGEFGPGFWLQIGPNQRTWSPDVYAYDISYRLGGIELLFGETSSSAKVNQQAKVGERTAETRLNSKRALIIIINQVTVYGVKSAAPLASSFLPEILTMFGTAEQIPIAEHTLVYAFLHELAAHAGRMNQGKTATHGDQTVESIVTEIKEMFPKDFDTAHTLQVSAALSKAASRLGQSKPITSPSAKRRTPGPTKGPSGGARAPGPLR